MISYKILLPALKVPDVLDLLYGTDLFIAAYTDSTIHISCVRSMLGSQHNRQLLTKGEGDGCCQGVGVSRWALYSLYR